MRDSELWRLADPELAVALLGTLRHEGDAVVDELADRQQAAAWAKRQLHMSTGFGRVELLELRELLRGLFTAVVDGAAPPRGAIRTINALAAQAPVTLVARESEGGAVLVERTSRGGTAVVVRGEVARSALALLASPFRERLRLCRAPGCILFFLQNDPRQEWCSPSCGNRARVARHYARHSRHVV